MMTLTPLAEPAHEPVLPAEAKARLRLDHDSEDARIAALIVAARCHVEEYLRRSLITRPWRLVRDRWPRAERGLVLPRAPLRSVEAVRWRNSGGAWSTLDPADYRVETTPEPGFLLPEAGRNFPPTDHRPAAIEVDFTAGHGDDWNAVPAPIREALLLIVADLHEGGTGAPGPIVGTVRSLLDPYRLIGFADASIC